MQKRILALALAVILIAASFAGCGKKKDVVESKDGLEYEAVTDAQGNKTFTGEENVLVYQKDKDGNYIKDDKGEKKTVSVKVENGRIVTDDSLETKTFKFAFPRKDWYTNPRGRFYKEDTDGEVSLGVYEIPRLAEGETRDTVYERFQLYVKQLEEETAKPETEYTVDAQLYDTVVTDKKLVLKGIDEKIYLKGQEGVHQHYATAYVFTEDGRIYNFDYACTKGEFYDESIDLVQIINDYFIAK